MNQNNTSYVVMCIVFLFCACQKPEPNVNSTALSTPHLPTELLDYESTKIPEQVARHPAAQALVRAFGGEVGNDPQLFTDTIFIDEDFIFEGRFGLGGLSDKEIPNITNSGATLGRVLFYDKQLSINNTVACASCHEQAMAFADGRKLSPGYQGAQTKRNSMGILNPGLNENMFWDSRTATVKKLVLRPVQDHIEMGMESMDLLESKLSQSGYYATLFQAAYGSSQVTEEGIADALTQFLCSMTTFNSKYDQVQNDATARLTATEEMGRVIFFGNRAKCSSCHAEPNFAAPDFPGGPYGGDDVAGTANIGLDVSDIDVGKGSGKFRMPSLRNIEMTGPYMHDGRFNTLMDVVNHYDHGVQSNPSLDKKLKDSNGLPQRLHLNVFEKEALVAFLHTLTDHEFLNDEKFSDPFAY